VPGRVNSFLKSVLPEIRKHPQSFLSPAPLNAAPGARIVSKRMGNIPARQVNAQHARTPCSSHPATFFFKS